MDKPRVLVTSALPEAGMALLQNHVAVTCPDNAAQYSYDEIIDHIHDTDGVICMLSDRIDKKVMDAGHRLKIIANYAVGFNNIDVQEATKQGIVVTNTPDVLTETTADLTFALVLGIARRIVEADRYARSGAFSRWAPTLMLGSEVHGKTLGIIGFGRIGQAVARRARGFDMYILYHEPKPKDHSVERTYEALYCGLETLLSEADFVSLHVPLTDTTHHMISAKEFSIMKKSAFLINVSRGPVVDEQALIKALSEKTIAGCALDVYEHEPDISPELLTMDNTVLVPHIGSATEEARTKMAVMAAESVVSVLVSGTPPVHVINPEVYQAEPEQ